MFLLVIVIFGLSAHKNFAHWGFMDELQKYIEKMKKIDNKYKC